MRRYLLGSLLLSLCSLAFVACHKPPKPKPQCTQDQQCAEHQVCRDNKCICAPTYGRCGGLCVPILSSQVHCGGCGNLCKGGRLCVEGSCVCANGTMDCGACVDIQTDSTHCGACGRACDGVERCVEGQCCPEDKATLCDAVGTPGHKQCTNIRQNPQHCGACGKQCKSGQICDNGQCRCPPGHRLCGGQCINPMDDAAHCGKCGNVCAAQEACASGRCVPKCPKDTPDRCGRTCCHTKTHPKHCGRCGNACRPGMLCRRGQCVCPPHTRACGSKGLCVDTQTHPKHCGACGIICKRGHYCSQGRCIPKCLKRYPKGCYGGCFAPKTSPQHCGRCGITCKGGQLCVEGSCRCPSGMAMCDGRCIDIESNPIHCGTCGNKCPTGTLCAKGKCVDACPKDRDAACYGACKDTQSNRSNCGECGAPCLPAQICDGGICKCPPKQTLCSDRCVDTKTHPKHCGSCDKVCPDTQICEEGSCIDPCPSDKPDRCNDTCTDTKKDTRNCGVCGKICPQGSICDQGKCRCPKGQDVCNDKCTDITHDRENCGACGKRCPDDQSCTNKQCTRCQRCLHCTPQACHTGQCNSHADRAGGAHDDIPARITTDKEGNSYSLGLFQGSAVFGRYRLKAALGYSLFVTKRTPSGQYVWTRKIDVTGFGRLPPVQGAIALDCHGNIYVSHVYRQKVLAGQLVVTSSSSKADTVFLLKLNPAGQFIWLRSSKNLVHASSRGLVVRDDGRVYLVGNALGSIGFGNSSAGAQQSIQNPYLARFDSDGKLIWVKRPFSAGSMQVFGMAATPSGKLAMAGRFQGSIRLGSKRWQAAADDAFTSVVADDGQPLWMQTLGGTGKDAAHDVTTDADGNVYPTGYFQKYIKCGKHYAKHKSRGIFVAKFGPKGTPQWLVTPIPYADSVGEAIATGPRGQLYATGHWISSSSVKTGRAILQPKGANGAFILRLEPQQGAVTWGDTAGGPKADLGTHDISVDAYGNAHTIGCFARTALASGVSTTSAGGIDVHLWKVGAKIMP